MATLLWITGASVLCTFITPLSFEEYAARLSGSNTWWFWWD